MRSSGLIAPYLLRTCLFVEGSLAREMACQASFNFRSHKDCSGTSSCCSDLRMVTWMGNPGQPHPRTAASAGPLPFPARPAGLQTVTVSTDGLGPIPRSLFLSLVYTKLLRKGHEELSHPFCPSDGLTRSSFGPLNGFRPSVRAPISPSISPQLSCSQTTFR